MDTQVSLLPDPIHGYPHLHCVLMVVFMKRSSGMNLKLKLVL